MRQLQHLRSWDPPSQLSINTELDFPVLLSPDQMFNSHLWQPELMYMFPSTWKKKPTIYQELVFPAGFSVTLFLRKQNRKSRDFQESTEMDHPISSHLNFQFFAFPCWYIFKKLWPVEYRMLGRADHNQTERIATSNKPQANRVPVSRTTRSSFVLVACSRVTLWDFASRDGSKEELFWRCEHSRPRAYDPSGLRQESRALGATISGMRHRWRLN